MKRVLQWAVCLVIISAVLHLSLFAQSKAPRPVGCKQCHECEIPTKLNPCLKKCPRDRMVTAHPSADAGPGIVTLNAVTGAPDVYEPVKFNHSGHAHMSDMSGGCAQCHHYNLTGDVLSCKACHAVSPSSKNADLSKPNLKGAYHRQCVNCHRESGLEATCDGICHRAKSSAAVTTNEAPPQKTAVHVMKPDRLVFESANADAKTVTFYHNDHTDRFGLACSSCHTNERCSTCHRADAGSAKPLTHLEGGHDRCATCHSVTENCEKCHGATPLARFNHAQKTKFDLGRFHSTFACGRCHKAGTDYKGLTATCTSCHTGWKPGSFNHVVTGIRLSENHSSLDCESCHLESNFTTKPACNACHEDKSYPSSLPGARVKAVKTVKK